MTLTDGASPAAARWDRNVNNLELDTQSPGAGLPRHIDTTAGKRTTVNEGLRVVYASRRN